MGLSSSTIELEHLGSSKQVTINSQTNNMPKSEQYKLYQSLSRMGFDNELILRACDKYKNPQQLENAITDILSQKRSLIIAKQSSIISIHKSSDRSIIEHKSDIMSSGELEMDEDGYYKLITNKDSINKSLTPQLINKSLIEDEVIKFHLQLHKESIEEIRAINDMAEEYEQQRIYTEMLEMEEKDNIKKCINQMQKNLQRLQITFYKQCQLLYQNYQIEIMGKDDICIQLLQNEFQMQMAMLKENCLNQKKYLDENTNKLQQLFDSYEKKYTTVCENEDTFH